MSCLAELPHNLYTLAEELSGRSFFDHWRFTTTDANWGASDYLPRAQAEHDGLVEAHEHYAIVRTGGRSWRNGYKRTSVRLETQRSWKYFLAAA